MATATHMVQHADGTWTQESVVIAPRPTIIINRPVGERRTGYRPSGH